MKLLAVPFRSVVQYFQGAYREFRHVTWPTRQAVIAYTILVLSTMVISVLVIMAFDYGLRQLADRYLIR
jgi:preprotein translocase SecE subunit